MEKQYNKYIKDLYDSPAIYIKEFENYHDDIYFWPKIVDKVKPINILEVGIGNGRLIGLLHDKVKEYDGIDFSREIIEYCSREYDFSNVTLYNQDLKQCYIDKKYDLIIMPFNVINNFYSKNDISEMFTHLRELCHKNTLIVIDTINPKTVDLMTQDEYKRCNEFEVNGKVVEVYEKKYYDEPSATCVYNKRYIVEGNIVKEVILPNRIFSCVELQSIIKMHNFQIINSYGDYNFEDLSRESRKQIYVLRRK